MNRSGYSDSCEGWDLIRWRGAVESAIRGKRGQAFLLEMLAALDALPQKRLIANDLVVDGEYCALGAVGARRGLDMTTINPEDHCAVAKAFNIPHSLACEIEFMNDNGLWCHDSPEERFVRMRQWIVEKLQYTIDFSGEKQ